MKTSLFVATVLSVAFTASCTSSSGSRLDPEEYLDSITTCRAQTIQKYGQQDPLLIATICDGQYWELHPDAAKAMCEQDPSNAACLYAG